MDTRTISSQTVTSQAGFGEASARPASPSPAASGRTSRGQARSEPASARQAVRRKAAAGTARPWRLRPRTRKFVLTAHVAASVGWIGVAGSLLTLGVVGLTSEDTSVYRAIGVLGGTFLAPASVAVVVTGVLLGLGTKWGLIRHYWVAAKLALTIVLVLGANFGLGGAIRRAAARVQQGGDVAGLRDELVLTSLVSLALLIVMTVLSVYKPWGRTRYGR